MAASVRYVVDDVDEAIRFYRDLLGFEVVMHPAPSFAMLARATGVGGDQALLDDPSGNAVERFESKR